MGPADVLEEKAPFPLELSDVDTLAVRFLEPCMTGCGRIVGNDLFPFERPLGLPFHLDHEVYFPLPLKLAFAMMCDLPLFALPLPLLLPLLLGLPLSELL